MDERAKQWGGKEITEWAQSQFGPTDAFATAIRMNKEVAECLSALYHDKLHVARGEVADLGVMLKQIGYKMNIHEFGNEVVASVSSKLTLGMKFNAEFAVLIIMLTPGIGATERELFFQFAKLMTILRQLALAVGVNLDDVVSAKMDINVQRTWAKGEDGSFQHE